MKIATIKTFAGEMFCQEHYDEIQEAIKKYRPQLEVLQTEINKL